MFRQHPLAAALLRRQQLVVLAVMLHLVDSRTASRSFFGDSESSTFECNSSEPWIGPFAYGAEPVPQKRCVARHVQLSSDPPLLHAFVQDLSERERLRRMLARQDSAVEFHMHTMGLPLVVHDEPLPLCVKQVDTALAFSVPDLSNLYHTFFDLLVPLQDTITSLNLSNPTLLALHNPVVTRAQPWLSPIRFTEPARPPVGAVKTFFKSGDSWNIETEAPTDSCRLDEGNGRTAYQFVDYFGAVGPATVSWLTAHPAGFPDDLATRRQHQACLRRFELHRQDGVPQVVLPLPDVLETRCQNLCVEELHLNLRLRGSLWQYEHTAISPDAHGFIFAAFRSLFRERIPRQFGLIPSSEDVRAVIVLVRTKNDTRPTKDVDALERAVQVAVTRASQLAHLQLHLVDAAALSLREQVRTFSRCLMLVGDHGAGLSNVVFMPRGSAVVELTHTGCGVHCGDYFRPVADLSGVTHRRFSADNLTAGDPEFAKLLDQSITLALRGIGMATGDGRVSDTKLEL